MGGVVSTDFAQLKEHALALHDLLRDHKDRKVQMHLRKLVYQLEMMEGGAAQLPESVRELVRWLTGLCDAEHGALVKRYAGDPDGGDAPRIARHVKEQKRHLHEGMVLYSEVERGVKHLAGMLGVSGVQSVAVPDRISWFANALLEHLREDREVGRQLHQLALTTMESLRSVQEVLLGMGDESPELRHVKVMLSNPIPDDPQEAHHYLMQVSANLQQVQRQMVDEGRRMRHDIGDRLHDFETVSSQIASMQQQTRSDTLTGLPNRRALKEFLAEQPLQDTVSLAMVDVDRLQQINESAGEAAGDRALCEIAELFSGRIRERDMLFRIGGDEFVVVFPGVNGAGAVQAALGLHGSVCQKPLALAGRRVGIELSFGVAERLPDERLHAWLKRADAALYVVKGRGGNGVELAP
ncbi:MAG: GGDEF domain-containing protein [Mariprofundales bacterium]|nr:GGDEF domain-containing protein [Mariprofundales bacterium]